MFDILKHSSHDINIRNYEPENRHIKRHRKSIIGYFILDELDILLMTGRIY